MFYYVENWYGTAGMGNSFGYAQVVENETPIETYVNQTDSLSGPYSREEAQQNADNDNAIHDAYRNAQN